MRWPDMSPDELRAYIRRLRALIVQAAASLSDSDALDGIELYDHWAADTEYPADKRLQHEGKLYRVRQLHTSQAIYPPGSAGTEALYARVERPGQGDTPDNPIPYEGNLELVEGKYYSQDGVTYVCTRSTGAPVYHPLAQLVGLYVEVWTG